MRGDSLRDLYAKALALVGLGLLACAGAIVDYWPVPGDVPRVARAPRPLPPAAGVPALAKLVLPAPPALRDPIRRTSEQPGARPSQTGEVFLTLAESPQPLGQPIELSAPPADHVAAAIDDEAALRDTPADASPLVSREPWPAPVAPVLQLASNPPADGFITGALKKTGESIVKTGAVTGASIVDAFRGVFGAFKKVSPFAPNVAMATARY
jgi:hypothetical protein